MGKELTSLSTRERTKREEQPTRTIRERSLYSNLCLNFFQFPI